MKHAFPKWFFHKEICPDGKIIRSEAEYESLGAGWVESPSLFEVVETPKEEAIENQEIKKIDYVAMTVPQLKAALIEKGIKEEEVKGLKKDELIVKLGSL